MLAVLQVILLGTDVPDLTSEIIVAAAQELETNDVCLGPARDGGYYLIGLQSPHKALFQGIQWSTDTVLASTRAAASSLGLKLLDPCALPKLRDIDVLEVRSAQACWDV